jgi:hypothetical protein
MDEIKWTPNPAPEPWPKVKKSPWKTKIAVTLGEQVEENIREWCAAQGIPVPPEDLAMCKEIDAAAARELAKDLAQPPAAVEKPSYGTPEFWKQYWAKKNAAKAALAAQK